MGEDNFIWTNELVIEFKYFKSDLASPLSAITQFKKSKEVKKDYEILQCENDVFGIHDFVDSGNTPCLKEFKPCKIHSVKRLSDNEVFTIGEENIIGGVVTEIEQFIIEADTSNIVVCGKYEKGINGSSYLKELLPTKEVPEYILMNKPLLSLNDLLDAWVEHKGVDKINNHALYSTAPLFLNFKDLAKQKLNK